MSEPPEPAAEPLLAKSTVTHKLAFAGKNPELALLHGCVLSGFSPDYHKSDIVRTRALQHSLRCHYYNLITANPEQRYALTYSLNCPPPAFKVTPKTRCCTNPDEYLFPSFSFSYPLPACFIGADICLLVPLLDVILVSYIRPHVSCSFLCLTIIVPAVYLVVPLLSRPACCTPVSPLPDSFPY